MESTEKDLSIFEGDRAVNYDSFVQQWIPNYDYFMSIIPKVLAIAEYKSLLAVGCGTGNELMALKECNPEWSVLGVDPSPEMIQIAKAKLAYYDDVDFYEGKVESFKSDTLYGAASLLLVLHFIKYPNEKLALLNAIKKRLRPGAPLIIMGIFGDREQLRTNLKILPSLIANHLSQSEVDERIDRITNKLHRTTEEELEKLLQRAGFGRPNRFYQTSIYSAYLTYRHTI